MRVRSAIMRLKRTISCRSSCGPRSRSGLTVCWRDNCSAAAAMSRTGRWICQAISKATAMATPTTRITPGSRRLSGGGLTTHSAGIAIQSCRCGSLTQMRVVCSSSSRTWVPGGMRCENCSTSRRARPLAATVCSAALASLATSTRLGSLTGGCAASARWMLSNWNII